VQHDRRIGDLRLDLVEDVVSVVADEADLLQHIQQHVRRPGVEGGLQDRAFHAPHVLGAEHGPHHDAEEGLPVALRPLHHHRPVRPLLRPDDVGEPGDVQLAVALNLEEVREVVRTRTTSVSSALVSVSGTFGTDRALYVLT
jgi:hypothetical protein